MLTRSKTTSYSQTVQQVKTPHSQENKYEQLVKEILSIRSKHLKSFINNIKASLQYYKIKDKKAQNKKDEALSPIKQESISEILNPLNKEKYRT